MTRRPRKTPAQWAQIVADFHASGLSARDFCDKQNIGMSTLDKWKRQHAADASSQPVGPSFIRVQSPSEIDSTHVTLRTRDGVTVMCPLAMGVDTIAALTLAIGNEG